MKKLYYAVILSLLTFMMLLTGCYDVTIFTAVEGLPDAENSIATENGRFFVTCTGGVYEIVKSRNPASESEYQKIMIIRESGDFLGIAEYNGILYTAWMKNIFESYIYSYNLSTGEKKIIYRFTKVLMPNGIDFDASGNLYVNDQIDLSLKLGRIVKLTFNHGTGEVTGESIWLDRGITAPNGMAYSNGSLYITDLSSVKRIPVINGLPGTVQVLYTRALHFLDDLEVYGTSLIVCDFGNGTVFELDTSVKGGKVIRELDAQSISGPSSVVHGSATNNLFDSNSVVVTSKGILKDTASNIGNSLVYFYLP